MFRKVVAFVLFLSSIALLTWLGLIRDNVPVHETENEHKANDDISDDGNALESVSLPPPPAMLATAPSPIPPTTSPQLAVTKASESFNLERQLLTVGHSVAGNPIVANGVGSGAFKIVAVGGGKYLEIMLDSLLANPDLFPAEVALWMISDPNPDSENNTNANGVDIFLNGDPLFDGCLENDWQEPVGGAPSGEAHPLSEPEAAALAAFSSDATAVILYDADLGGIVPAGCPVPENSDRLAGIISAASGFNQLPYQPKPGNLADHIAAGGTATVSSPIDKTSPGRNVTAMRKVLESVQNLASANNTTWLDDGNMGAHKYPPGSFPHPLGFAVVDDSAFIVAAGSVILLNLNQPGVPATILDAGDNVAGIPVVEPIDIVAGEDAVYVLDRTGDVYRYSLGSRAWTVDRYDRPVGTTSSHYYVAIDSVGERLALLETDYHLALLFGPQKSESILQLEEHLMVDLTADGDRIFILSRSSSPPSGRLDLYRGGLRVQRFDPAIQISQPRQVGFTSNGAFLLDQAGRRLVQLDAEEGKTIASYQFKDGRMINAFWVSPDGKTIILARDDVLNFVQQPEKQETIDKATNGASPRVLSFDKRTLIDLRGLLMPIGGSDLTPRQNQMPGAPRHYRLGVHEGLDLYWQRGTVVRSISDGLVIRATNNYVQPAAEHFNLWRAETLRLGTTSAEAQDFYRGMQIWVAHQDGLISRYVHLSEIYPEIIEGARVERGQPLGEVGNSGSPLSLESESADAHLHLELWLADQYLGQYLRPIETREWLETILRK